ncbi:hypothetical protein IB232_22345 [Pseudomonas sp. PDM15]|uniref:hypothetical protein n=1 Tax=Pseudomonas sp. PDM15 TaxID=2769303 RepID=UPI001784A86C|nr:hypothetical protein [Pseudomonas sp. PDM15]MBD9428083.1 hypothetical protein [Pseudomonas sp. PDM15]
MYRSEVRLTGRDVFLLLCAADAITSVSVRGQVYDQTSPDLGIRANLLLDYQSPVFAGCPHGTVVAASCLFDGLTDEVYQEVIARALAQVHPQIAAGTSAREALSMAESQAFDELIFRPEARTLTIDEHLMAVAANHGLLPRVSARVHELPSIDSQGVLRTPRRSAGLINTSVIRSAIALDCRGSPFTEAALASLIGVLPQAQVVEFPAPEMR